MTKNTLFPLFAAALFTLACFSVNASDIKSYNNREKMIEIMELYLAKLVKNEPKGLPISKTVKITENGYPIHLGEGLFQTAKKILFTQYMVDPSTGQVAVFSVVQEDVMPTNTMIRLKLKWGKIIEIETIIARDGEASIAAPNDLMTPKPIYDELLSEANRLSRDEMIAVADSYFDGIEQNTSEIVPFHPDCNRTENGARTTNVPPRFTMGCKEQFDAKVFTYITHVRNRRFLIVDEERGLVWGIFVFDIPGKREHFEHFPIPFEELPKSVYKPRSIFVSELFKIVNGQIIEIEAVMVNTPFGATSGWRERSTQNKTCR